MADPDNPARVRRAAGRAMTAKPPGPRKIASAVAYGAGHLRAINTDIQNEETYSRSMRTDMNLAIALLEASPALIAALEDLAHEANRVGNILSERGMGATLLGLKIVNARNVIAKARGQ